MADDEKRKKFPDAFPVGVPPKGAREESITVYRVCRTGKVEAASFLPTYLDPQTPYTKENQESSPYCGYYSMSTFEKRAKAKQILKCLKRHSPPAILSKGETAPECGWILRDKEMLEIEELRQCIQEACAEEHKDPETMRKSSHVHWWLYEGAEPHRFFQPVEET